MEQLDEDQEEDRGGVDPQREETIGNVFVSVLVASILEGTVLLCLSCSPIL